MRYAQDIAQHHLLRLSVHQQVHPRLLLSTRGGAAQELCIPTLDQVVAPFLAVLDAAGYGGPRAARTVEHRYPSVQFSLRSGPSQGVQVEGLDKALVGRQTLAWRSRGVRSVEGLHAY